MCGSWTEHNRLIQVETENTKRQWRNIEWEWLCVCVCVRERERERHTHTQIKTMKTLFQNNQHFVHRMCSESMLIQAVKRVDTSIVSTWMLINDLQNIFPHGNIFPTAFRLPSIGLHPIRLPASSADLGLNDRSKLIQVSTSSADPAQWSLLAQRLYCKPLFLPSIAHMGFKCCNLAFQMFARASGTMYFYWFGSHPHWNLPWYFFNHNLH